LEWYVLAKCGDSLQARFGRTKIIDFALVKEWDTSAEKKDIVLRFHQELQKQENFSEVYKELTEDISLNESTREVFEHFLTQLTEAEKLQNFQVLSTDKWHEPIISKYISKLEDLFDEHRALQNRPNEADNVFAWLKEYSSFLENWRIYNKDLLTEKNRLSAFHTALWDIKKTIDDGKVDATLLDLAQKAHDKMLLLTRANWFETQVLSTIRILAGKRDVDLRSYWGLPLSDLQERNWHKERSSIYTELLNTRFSASSITQQTLERVKN
jgi:hypothetical protein